MQPFAVLYQPTHELTHYSWTKLRWNSLPLVGRAIAYECFSFWFNRLHTHAVIPDKRLVE